MLVAAVDERQLRRARVAEEEADLLLLQDVEQQVAAARHLFESLALYGMLFRAVVGITARV